MEHPRSADAAARQLAQRQRSLITRDQARRCGLSDDQIDGRLQTGAWVRRARGVFAIGGAAGSWEQDLLVACLGSPGGTVAGVLSAAAVHQLWRPPPLPQVIAPPRTSGRQRIALVRKALVPATDRTMVRGIPCTTPARTIVDCASVLGREPLAALLDDAMCRKLTA